MAEPDSLKAAVEAGVADDPATPESGPARAGLTLADLASAILAGSFKPRVGEVRRLAEAVLAGKSKKKKQKTDKGKEASGTKRKLSKIPGQKRRK